MARVRDGQRLPPLSPGGQNQSPAAITQNRMGGYGNLLGVRWDNSSMIRLNSHITGLFRQSEFYHALALVHQDAAIKMQAAMVERLNSKIGSRAQRDGKRLEVALTSDKNRDIHGNTFTVGIRHWLDISPVKAYWRQIEEGAPARSGFILFGDGSQLGRAQGPYKAPGMSENQMRMPYFKQFGGRSRGVFVEDIGPWPAFHYLAAGVRYFNNLDMEALYERSLKANGYPITKSNRGDYFH